jgi:hypothetical protein
MKRMILLLLTALALLPLLDSCNQKGNVSATSGLKDSSITFRSSDSALNNTFQWAKMQALAYAFKEDPVGIWYEAGLPGREVFCMRDVSHQAMGAEFLGLRAYTKNMLYLMAKNISNEKDWCSFWEITRQGEPALQDYLNDKEFWYNLPANFDVLDCCFRMFELTGDLDYVYDPVFLNFYRRTVYDYVERWNLSMDKIMVRPRIMNNPPGNNRKFKNARGIPGYNEGDVDYTVGLDLLATEHAAFKSYARLQQLRHHEDEAAKFYKKAAEVAQFIDTVWWDNQHNTYYTHLDKDHKLSTYGVGQALLYWGVPEDTFKLRSLIDTLVRNLPKDAESSIEGLSHLPEILYKYDQPELADNMLAFIMQNERREYPEASFSVIGAMVSGLMGIRTAPYPVQESLITGHYPEQIIITRPGLGVNVKWAEINRVPIKGNVISLRHEGEVKTSLTNDAGPQLLWKAYFPGAYDSLQLNGQSVRAHTDTLLANGKPVSWVLVVVGAGETGRVQLPD